MTEEVRLGVIVPSVNTVVENWYPKIVPDGVSVHFARMLITESSPNDTSTSLALERNWWWRAKSRSRFRRVIRSASP